MKKVDCLILAVIALLSGALVFGFHEINKTLEIEKINKFVSSIFQQSLDYGEYKKAFLQIREFDSEKPISIYIPVGVAHGYIALEDETIISYKMDGFFCANCDGGISGEIINEYLPIDFADTIRSEKDLKLQDFENFHYDSSCVD